MPTIKDTTNITSPKRLTMNIKLKISPVYSDKLKQILQVLRNDDALGDYFMRFLLNHTLNELSNGEDYLKNWTTNIVKTFVDEFTKSKQQLTADIINELFDKNSSFYKLLEENIESESGPL